MPDQFYVNHNNYSVVNDGLAAEVTRMDSVMSDLNATLNRIASASGGKATPLWEEQQSQWNRAYEEMKMQLNTHTNSSFNVANNFLDGDNSGARAMS
jgi:uncharacterized protein YukE